MFIKRKYKISKPIIRRRKNTPKHTVFSTPTYLKIYTYIIIYYCIILDIKVKRYPAILPIRLFQKPSPSNALADVLTYIRKEKIRDTPFQKEHAKLGDLT